ncbi:ABC transporter permease, partial [Marinomonas sp. 42_23_T18]
MTLPKSKATPPLATEKKPMPWHIVFFLGPALLIYLTVSVYPLLDTLILSLYDEQQGQSSFVGLQNFVTLINDENWSTAFWNALGNNFKFFIIHMLIQNPIGLLLAVLLSSP